MTAGVRVIGLGQRAAGDDGVGLVVLERLRAAAPPGVELFEAADATALVPLVEARAVVLVDAVVGGGAPGEVVELAEEDLGDGNRIPLSTHGLGVAEAIALARMLAPERVAPSVRVVGVCIARPDRYGEALSPAVAAAVPAAVARVLRLVAAEAA